MKRLVVLLLVAFVTLGILLFITNPELLEQIWLWIIGFIGYIAAGLRKGFRSLSSWLKGSDDDEETPPSNAAVTPPAPVVPSTPQELARLASLQEKIAQLERQLAAEQARPKGQPLGTETITVLRYLDDKQSTLGLLFFNNKFFTYTLEDTYREVKKMGETRIPAGTYAIDYNPVLTPLTKTYRKSRDWFTYHLEIKDIPNYKNVYIHVGNTHHDTAGCLLVADGVNAASKQKMITSSRKAFERFYKKVVARLASGKPVTIRILDEDWINHSVLQQP